MRINKLVIHTQVRTHKDIHTYVHKRFQYLQKI